MCAHPSYCQGVCVRSGVPVTPFSLHSHLYDGRYIKLFLKQVMPTPTAAPMYVASGMLECVGLTAVLAGLRVWCCGAAAAVEATAKGGDFRGCVCVCVAHTLRNDVCTMQQSSSTDGMECC